jgi:D-glycero-D-manno-heptose 1,7-bisphosphate phosphatase
MTEVYRANMKIADKLISRDDLKYLCDIWRNDGKKIGFTSGSFDIMHAGHAAYLEQAKALCDVLIVGVNSDISVKKYKGDSRPIIPEAMRIALVAALESVNYTFLFDERRNSENISELKPHIYIKAGDYKESELSSKELVESYGGKVAIIPVVHKISTSDIISKIIGNEMAANNIAKDQESRKGKVDHNVQDTERCHDPAPEPTEIEAVQAPLSRTKKSRAIFLDRDGTINEDVEYLHEPGKFRFTPNAMEGLKKLQNLGFRLVVITTQAGIGLGYFTKEDFYKVNREMFRQLATANVVIDRIYFCPHGIGDNCNCRKPKTGLFERAESDLNIDMKASIMIGDKTSDVEAGKRAGCMTILVKTGKPDFEYDVKANFEAADLLDAANHILKLERAL